MVGFPMGIFVPYIVGYVFPSLDYIVKRFQASWVSVSIGIGSISLLFFAIAAADWRAQCEESNPPKSSLCLIAVEPDGAAHCTLRSLLQNPHFTHPRGGSPPRMNACTRLMSPIASLPVVACASPWAMA